jgi:uncharacterized protein YkwD
VAGWPLLRPRNVALAVLMEIIMRRFLAAASLLAVSILTSAAADVSGASIVRELSLARENPKLYAAIAEESRTSYNGRYFALPGGTRIFPKERLRSLDEAIQFLRSVSPLPPLIYSAGLSRGAADHCADQATGGFSHAGRDGSDPGARMSRYGRWGVRWGENIAYGKTSARDIVLALIIDDGLRGRKHRKNIFNPVFKYAGAAYGPHAKFGSVCTMDFAGAYMEGDERSLLAKF